MSKSLKSILGGNVRQIRQSRARTQEQLAEELDVTPRYLAGIERGERNLTLDSIETLAGQLGVEPRSLLEGPAATARTDDQQSCPNV